VTQIILKPGHVQPVWAGHPWIFAQAVGEIRGDVQHGGEVEVLDARGNSLGRGLYSEGSALAVRLFSRIGDEPFDSALLGRRLAAAAARRRAFGLPDADTTGYRVFHGEGDGIPGLVIDRFGSTLVVQFGSAGVAQRSALVFDALEAHFSPSAIIDRTSEKAARADRFELVQGLARGEMPDTLDFVERGLAYELPLSLAQKTGFYFDQRPLRARIEHLARGKSVLDGYSYVGAIGLSAARGGASRVVSVDSSGPALEVGRELAQKNRLDVHFERSDTLAFLSAGGPDWDIVVGDPPKLAQSRAGRDKAQSAFRRIAAVSVRAVKPGGLVVLSSCSAALGLREIERCLALGARDAERSATTLERVFQGIDHPVPPAFAEGLYLTTLIAQVD